MDKVSMSVTVDCDDIVDFKPIMTITEVRMNTVSSRHPTNFLGEQILLLSCSLPPSKSDSLMTLLNSTPVFHLTTFNLLNKL